jgi:hypothetical protein
MLRREEKDAETASDYLANPSSDRRFAGVAV